MIKNTLLNALADPTRLRIVALLHSMELSVGELAHILGQTQPGISRHVKLLVEAGICQRRKEGSWTFLRLDTSPPIRGLLAALDRIADPTADRWQHADIMRLDAIRADRSDAAQAFFDANAERWDGIRALHVAEADVAKAMERALDSRPLGRLVDIGTGAGHALMLLAGRADRAIGIDRSPEMLRFARSRIAEAGLSHTELRQGDMYALPLEAGSADTIVLHQVLHYAQSPGAAIAEAARLLDHGGRMLIVDVAPHQHDELRSVYGHARLGFDDEQIAGWYTAAGLEPVLSEALPGGELTIRLWLAQRNTKASPLKAVA
jgi:ArsR family transcriptional regulator